MWRSPAASPGPSVAAAIAEHVRARVRDDLGVTVSVCVASSRTTAKVGSDRAKPDGLLAVAAGEDAAFLAPLPIRDLPLVGPKLAERLRAVGVHTIGHAAALDRRWLEQRFGSAGVLLHDRSRGIDPTPVRAGGRAAKSISREVTFHEDVTDPQSLRRTLGRHSERVASDLRRAGRRARTVTLKLRWSDFTTLTRSRTVERPLQTAAALMDVGRELLDELLRREGMRPVRLIGLGASKLVEDAVQLGFEEFESEHGAGPRDQRLNRALDDIRERFGEGRSLAVADVARPKTRRGGDGRLLGLDGAAMREMRSMRETSHTRCPPEIAPATPGQARNPCKRWPNTPDPAGFDAPIGRQAGSGRGRQR